MKKSYAIFLSTSDHYFAGTCVALHSFLSNNPWFDGDIAVVSDGLSTDKVTFLSSCFDNLKVDDVDHKIRSRYEQLAHKNPGMRDRFKIFYNLQVFALEGYERVLKIDSDMLFRGNVRHLFTLNSPIAGCPGRPMYRGESRSKKDLSFVALPDPQAFSFWMNAGLYSLSGNYINDKVYSHVLEYMDVSFWEKQNSMHTDQIGINFVFDGKIESLPPIYNYLLPHEKSIFEYSGFRAEQGIVWHYVGKDKPWDMGMIPRKCSRLALRARKQWLACYMDLMGKYHLGTLKKDIYKEMV